MTKVTNKTNYQEAVSEKSYFESRMEELGVTTQLNMFTADSFYDDFAQNTFPIFEEATNGDISIRYAGLNGWKSYLYNGKTERPYLRIRKHPKSCINGYKYHTPKGATAEVFFPPKVLEAYKKKIKIRTLVVTEGEFKAFKASIHGLYCIGLQGIHNAAEKDNRDNKILNTEITKIIKVCNVENILLLFDADSLSIKYEADKDLYKRPNSFCSAVINFREYCKSLNVDLYFSHIKTDSNYKGLDDLLIAHKGNEAEIIEDCLALKNKSEFFECQPISDKAASNIKKYFFIDSATAFYNEYKTILEDKIFIFNHLYYQHNDGKLNELVSEEIKRFVRVGDDYYKEIFRPDKQGLLHRSYEKRSKQTIVDDFGRKAIKYIKKYEGFCNVPSHTNYQQEHCGFFNKYHRLTHIANAGEYQNIITLLKHVFADKIEFILDYLKIMYENPTQPLPIVLLESKERNTGKSTVVQLVLDIFQDNGVKLGNSDIQNDFNSFWIESLAIVVDETSLDKKGIGEMLKRLSTERGEVISNAKNKAQTKTDFFGKFFFCTNNEGEALTIERGETRYAVFKVPTLQVDDKDMPLKIQQEIPAFLHFLLSRPMTHPHVGRMYFDFNVYKTDALDRYYENSVTSIEQSIKHLIVETFKMSGELELKLNYANIVTELEQNIKWITQPIVKKALQNFKCKQVEKQERYEYHSLKSYQHHDPSDINPLQRVFQRNGQPFVFNRVDYIEDEIVPNIGKNINNDGFKTLF